MVFSTSGRQKRETARRDCLSIADRITAWAGPLPGPLPQHPGPCRRPPRVPGSNPSPSAPGHWDLSHRSSCSLLSRHPSSLPSSRHPSSYSPLPQHPPNLPSSRHPSSCRLIRRRVGNAVAVRVDPVRGVGRLRILIRGGRRGRLTRRHDRRCLAVDGLRIRDAVSVRIIDICHAVAIDINRIEDAVAIRFSSSSSVEEGAIVLSVVYQVTC